MRRGTLNDWRLCNMVQVVLSCDADSGDFDRAVADIPGFDINMRLDFLRRPLLHLLIIDIYNKQGRCGAVLRERNPEMYTKQLQRLQHLMELGSDMNLGGTQHSYSALQIAVFLNLPDVLQVMFSAQMPGSALVPNLNVVTTSTKFHSLLRLLVSGYFFGDPLDLHARTSRQENVLACIAILNTRSQQNIYAINMRDIYDDTVMHILSGVYGVGNKVCRIWDDDINDYDCTSSVYVLRDLFESFVRRPDCCMSMKNAAGERADYRFLQHNALENVFSPGNVRVFGNACRPLRFAEGTDMTVVAQLDYLSFYGLRQVQTHYGGERNNSSVLLGGRITCLQNALAFEEKWDRLRLMQEVLDNRPFLPGRFQGMAASILDFDINMDLGQDVHSLVAYT